MSNKGLFEMLLDEIKVKTDNPTTLEVVKFYIDNPNCNIATKKELMERLNISRLDYLQTEKEILEILKQIAEEL